MASTFNIYLGTYSQPNIGIKKNFLKHDKNVTHTQSVINIRLDEKFDIFSLKSVTRQRGFFSPFLFNTIPKVNAIRQEIKGIRLKRRKKSLYLHMI